MPTRLMALLTFVVLACAGCGSQVPSEAPSEANGVSTLIEAFKDESDNNMVAADAMYKLVEIGKPAVPKLIEAVESQEKRVKLMALNTLGLIGPAAADAIPAVKTALQHPDKHVQDRAADALQKIEAK